MKPLLSELFLPCSGKHSPMRANRYPLTTITGAQRASGQTHSRARSHQDGADLRADRSTAYLVSCIRVCSAHGNSLDHLVGTSEQRRWHFAAERFRGFEVDHRLVFGRRLHWQVGRLLALKDSIDVASGASELVYEIRSIGDQTAGVDVEPLGIDSGEFVAGSERDHQVAMSHDPSAAADH